MQNKLVLASTSPFRAELLNKLGLQFTQHAPDCDETALPDESAADLVNRLAVAKALSVQSQFDQDTTIIGSDQVANLDRQIIGKPGDHTSAVAQLRQLAGQTVVFYTGLCVVRDSRQLTCVVPTTVKFRELSNEQIERYLNADKPYNCAGSFKSESLGIALTQSMSSDDPSALIGLPLISLATFLTQLEIPVP